METTCEPEKLVFIIGVLALSLESTHNLIFNTYTMSYIAMSFLLNAFFFQRHPLKIFEEILQTVIVIKFRCLYNGVPVKMIYYSLK